MAVAIAPVTTLAAKLVDELERVVALRERWRAAAAPETPGGEAFAPILALLTLAVDDAKAALAADDALAALQALRQLEACRDG